MTRLASAPTAALLALLALSTLAAGTAIGGPSPVEAAPGAHAGIAGTADGPTAPVVGPLAQTAAGTVVVNEGETVGDLQTVAGTVLIRGTVTGDVSVVAGDVVIAETARVAGGVSGAAGSLHIAGTVDGPVQFAAGSVVIGPAATVGGDLSIGAGTLRLAGRVAGDARVGAETITVAPTARVGGDLRYDGDLRVQSGAAVAGSVIRDESIGRGIGTGQWTGLSIPGWFDTIYGFFANLLLGALLLLALPRFSTEVTDVVASRPLRSAGWGLVGLLCVPLALVVLALTVVGLPLALFGALTFGLLVWVSVVYGEYAVGRWIVGRADVDSRWAALLVGLLTVSILGLVPILGAVALVLALLVGLGALGTTIRARYAARRDDGDGPCPTDAPQGTTSAPN
ncbi:MAG: polymer-forming cytoskeletal protein [Halanaeroarchaeum sp.]